MEGRLAAFLDARAEVFAAIEPGGADATESSGLITRAAELAQTWPVLPPAERRRILLALLARVDIHHESVEICVLVPGLLSILRGETKVPDRSHKEESAETHPPAENRPQRRARVPAQHHQRITIVVVPTKIA